MSQRRNEDMNNLLEKQAKFDLYLFLKYICIFTVSWESRLCQLLVEHMHKLIMGCKLPITTVWK